MKCNIPKVRHRNNARDTERLHEELCKVRCKNCGEVIEIHETVVSAMWSYRQNKLCKKCKGADDEQREITDKQSQE